MDADVNLGAGPTGQRVDLHDEADRERVHAALRSVPSVVAARLVPGYERPIDELHVVTTLEKSPKQVVRDLQSLLYAHFGLSIDHRVVSVVQFGPEVTIEPPRSRLAIGKVAATVEGLEVRVGVSLVDQDKQYVGEATGPASALGRRRATATAALEAVRALLADRAVAEIEGVAVAPMLGHEVAISVVHLRELHAERTISGSALVREDESTAIARSVLDALNRELEPLR